MGHQEFLGPKACYSSLALLTVIECIVLLLLLVDMVVYPTHVIGALHVPLVVMAPYHFVGDVKSDIVKHLVHPNVFHQTNVVISNQLCS
jgi:hypothetical protein